MPPSRIPLLVQRRLNQVNQRTNSSGRRFWRFGLGCSTLTLIIISLLTIFAGLIYAQITTNLPSLNTIPLLLDSINGQLLQPTRFYDRTGTHLLYSLENQGVSRRYLSIDPQLPDHFSTELVQATLSLVEPNFWFSPGFSVESLLDEKPVTVAERLVNDLLLENESPGIFKTLRMRILSAQLVARYGRSRVIEWYLNSTSYGHLAFGADSAAQLYLGKSASELNLAESVLLASVSETPALNPLDSPAAAMEHYQESVERLCGTGIIGPADCDRIRQQEIVLKEDYQPAEGTAKAFERLVFDQLSNRYGRLRVERGGLRVITSLDYTLQQQLVCVLQTQLSRVAPSSESANSIPPDSCDAARLLPTISSPNGAKPANLAGSGLILDVKSGQILALTGQLSSNGESSSIVRGEPGSLLSPFVALAGFARGYSPSSLVWDIPTGLPAALQDFADPNATYHGPQRLRMALSNDYLLPMSQLLVQLFPDNVWRQAESFGLTGLTSENPETLLFKGGHVSLLEIAYAYNIFANLGYQVGTRLESGDRLSPVIILRVEDAAGIVLQDSREPATQSIVSSPIAYLVHNNLSDEVSRWPSLGYPNSLEIGRPAGVKIGRVADGRQAWTVGYTPEMLGAFWFGLPDFEPESEYQVDAKLPAGAWHAIMQYAGSEQVQYDWEVPQGVTQMDVCDPSGKLMTEDCPTPVREVFLVGNEPTEYDNLYRVMEVNRETGKLATVFTPLELVEEKTFIMLPPNASAWAKETGLEIPPEVYDTIQLPVISADVSIESPTLYGYASGQVDIYGTAGGEGFSSYRLQAGQGLNPRTWLQIGEDVNRAVRSEKLGTWDTRDLADGLYALRLTAIKQNQQIEHASILVTVDNTSPKSEIIDPVEGQTIKVTADSARIVLRADVADGTGIDRVVWTMDGNLIGLTREAPFVLSWEAAPGKHKLVITSYDYAGNVTVSLPVTFTVNP